MNTAGAFSGLFQMIVSFYGFIVIARFMLQLSGADFYNPLSQGVVKATNIPLKWIRKAIPPTQRYDFACLVWLFVVYVILYAALGFFNIGGLLPLPTLVFMSFKGAVGALLSFWMITIFVSVIASWIAMGQQNPALDLIHQLTQPILGPIQRVIPSAGGFDFSPIVALMAIMFLQTLFQL